MNNVIIRPLGFITSKKRSENYNCFFFKSTLLMELCFNLLVVVVVMHIYIKFMDSYHGQHSSLVLLDVIIISSSSSVCRHGISIDDSCAITHTQHTKCINNQRENERPSSISIMRMCITFISFFWAFFLKLICNNGQLWNLSHYYSPHCVQT